MDLSFKQINPSNPDLIEVIIPSIGTPTPEKLSQILASYNLKNHYIIGSFLDTKLVGIIGIEINNDLALIKHISVLEEFRNQGIARKLIQYITDNFSLSTITAETDEDAVGFYQALGFKCKSFKGKYGMRFECQLELK